MWVGCLAESKPKFWAYFWPALKHVFAATADQPLINQAANWVVLHSNLISTVNSIGSLSEAFLCASGVSLVADLTGLL